MKRELLKNIAVKLSPSGKAIDREGFLSAVLAVSVGSITGDPDSATLTVELTHADTADGDFAPVPDKMIDPERMVWEGGIRKIMVSDQEELCLSVDLLGCKRFIKVTPAITFMGGTTPKADTAAYALILGDPVSSPV